METKSQLGLRVNGVNIEEVTLRHPVVDGHLDPNRYEIQITDPAIGPFALTDECVIEVRRGRWWKTLNVSGLLNLLSPR